MNTYKLQVLLKDRDVSSTIQALEILDSLVESESDIHRTFQIKNLYNTDNLRHQLRYKGYSQRGLIFLWILGKLAELQVSWAVEVTSLDLSSTYVRMIPDNIVQLTNLRHLNLISNGLTELPSAICSLVNLEVLEIDSNYLSSIFDRIGNLKKLRKISMDGYGF